MNKKKMLVKGKGDGGGVPIAKLVSYYDMNNRVSDLVGINDGTFSGSYVTGKSGQAVQNTTSIETDCGNDATLQLSKGSLSCYFKTSSAGSSFRGIVTKRVAWSLFCNAGIIIAYSWGNNQIVSTGVNANDGVWRHLVLTFEDGLTSGYKVYIDSILKATGTLDISTQTDSLQIGGANQSVQRINGDIDGVGIWDDVLTQEEIDAIFAEQSAGNELVT